MQKLLQLRSISKSYKNGDKAVKVLSGANFSLYSGEMVALVAPSGSGKSTLLHICGLLDRLDEGEILIYNHICSNLSDKISTHIRCNEIGFIYQAHHLLPEFTALENVMMPQLIAGRSAKSAKKRAYDLLSYLNIADKANNRPGEMSGGQQQRVAIARSVANAPSILLADEPTGNLDPKTSQNVFNILQNLVRKVGLSALIATHNYALAKKMDRVITIEQGGIVELAIKEKL